jgi:hypothetical protein
MLAGDPDIGVIERAMSALWAAAHRVPKRAALTHSPGQRSA